MDKFPLLQKTDKEFILDYLTKDELFDAEENDGVIDKLYDIKRYPNFILDVFPVCLDKDSEDLKLLNSKYFICNQYKKYENFFKKVFLLNNSLCGIYTSIFCKYEYAYTFFLDRLDLLDRKDKFIFLHQVVNLYPTKHENFIIKDTNLLKIFSDGFAGDYIYGQIFFQKYPITVCHGYDMSLPIFIKREKDIQMYEKIANECGLFFRHFP